MGVSFTEQNGVNFAKRYSFDIYWLIISGCLKGGDVKNKILRSFKVKSDSKAVIVDQYILRDKDIIRHSRMEYNALAKEIEADLSLFEDLYKIVPDYYESLPWKQFFEDY